ncbi:hypothetical protein BJX99DRAFT_233999 [Aspergillus californicus]
MRLRPPIRYLHPPSPRRPCPGCSKYYYVISEDSCEGLASNFDISLDNFLSGNPGFGNDCRTLKTEFYVCVGVSRPT